MQLHELLRHLRTTSPLGRSSVTEASRTLLIPRDTINAWEKPGCRPDPERLRAYLEYLGCSHEQVLVALDLRSLPVEAEIRTEGAA